MNEKIRKTRLLPYTKNSISGKFRKTDVDGYRETTMEVKQEVRNANRSLKKAKRQQLKQELKTELYETD